MSLVVGLQVLWMFGTAVSKEMNLRSEKTVLLETRPVDPRDILRGDYVILNYKISTIPTAWLYPDAVPANVNNSAVHVILEKKGEFYQAVGAMFAPENLKAGQMAVRGTIDDAWRGATGGSIRVRYGIEKYFVPEGMGDPRGKLTVRCVVGRDGSLQIKEVFVDGKPYKSAVSAQ